MTPEAREKSAPGRQEVTSKQLRHPHHPLATLPRGESLQIWENQAFLQPERLTKRDRGMVMVACLGG